MDWKKWSGQITTGIGVLIGTPAVIALLAGQITWQQAVPFLVASIIGLIFPENQGAATAGQDAAVEKLLQAYRTGVSHGQEIGPQSTGAKS